MAGTEAATRWLQENFTEDVRSCALGRAYINLAADNILGALLLADNRTRMKSGLTVVGARGVASHLNLEISTEVVEQLEQIKNDFYEGNYTRGQLWGVLGLPPLDIRTLKTAAQNYADELTLVRREDVRGLTNQLIDQLREVLTFTNDF